MLEVLEPLTLTNVCNGELEKEFQKYYPEIIASLRDGDSGKLSIELSFKRVPNTTMMVNTAFTIKPTYPAKKKASICQIVGDGKLKTEKPVNNVVQLTIMNKDGAANE